MIKFSISENNEIPRYELVIPIEIIAVADKLTNEDLSIDNIGNMSVTDISITYKQISDAIIKIIEDFGYIELSHHKSDQSNSMYFTFCKESEFDIEEVALIIGMRVSDHDLPRWDKDTSKHDAENREKNSLKQFANNNKSLNVNLGADEEIPVDYIFVKYENEFYNTWEDVFKKIRQKLRAFSNKHK